MLWALNLNLNCNNNMRVYYSHLISSTNVVRKVEVPCSQLNKIDYNFYLRLIML